MKYCAVILIAEKELSQERFDTLLQFVSVERRERIERFRSFRDAQNCLLGDILARSEICRLTGLKNKELEFAVNEQGKPFLVNDCSIYYNVSHSGHYVALAIDDEPVGIDIERIRPFKDGVARRFFSQDEVEYVEKRGGDKPGASQTSRKARRLGCPREHRSEFRFFEIWTKKEARIKLEGKGLAMPLTSFSVLNRDEPERLFYHKVLENEEAVCHVCSAKPEPPRVRVMGVGEVVVSS